MKTSKFAKAIKCIMMVAVLLAGTAGLTSCLDLSQVTQSKDKIVAVVKTTDAILTKTIEAMDSVSALVKGSAAEVKVTEIITKVKSSLEVVQSSIKSIAKLLQIDLSDVSSQDNADLDELVNRLKKQIEDL